MRLTKRSVDALAKTGKLYWVDDDDLTGFRVGVTPAGTKVFAVRVRRGGRANRQDTSMTIGQFGVLTVDEARAMARTHLSRAQLGADVAGERRAFHTALTVKDLSDRFMADREGRIKEATLKEYRRLVKVELVPQFGGKVARDLQTRDVARWHSSRNDAPIVANRALRLMRTMFRWAEDRGEVPLGTMPTRGIGSYPERAKERFLSADEVGLLGKALRVAETVGLPPDPKRAEYAEKRAKKKQPFKITQFNPYAVAAIRFLLLSGWREQEVLTLRWDSIDVERGAAMLQDTKTGRSWRPLGKQAMELLDGLPRTDSPWVFPGQSPDTPFIEIKHVWHAVRCAAKLEDVRLHDLRHTFASNAVSGGLSLPMTSALLGHRDSKSTARYAHLADDPMKRAADDVSAGLAVHLNGKKVKVTKMGKTKKSGGSQRSRKAG
ncbi:MAG: tyrosine-type recombinase/integrase [Gemmatimonadetes bacterium]|nr:tyrosine-type recombinase/integrase [Gemmatimonadota bacterium]